MKINSISKLSYYLLFIVTLYSGCAKIVAPTGGPIDEQYPLIVEIDPPDYSTNFESKQISISFDEFIQLEDLNNNLIVSPPVEEKLDIKLKGKTLLINFEEDLKDSTTYNIYFGNSVQDLNEGNPIENFQYVLSTGSYIDSLSIQGQVINSFSLLPEEGVFVMLYSEHYDSIPIKEIPTYISKTNSEGFFRINNIKQDEYKLFCLRDLNKNYLFDIVDENIAFIDTLVTFNLITEAIIDTVFKSDTNNIEQTRFIQDSIAFDDSSHSDSLFLEQGIKGRSVKFDTLKLKRVIQKEIDSLVTFNLITEAIIDTVFKSDTNNIQTRLIQDSIAFADPSYSDSLFLERGTIDRSVQSDTLKLKPVIHKEIDSIIVKSYSYFPVQDYVLMLFTEEGGVQYLTNNARETKQKIEFAFNKPIKDSVIFNIADTIMEEDWYIKEVGINNDSLTYWLKDSSLYNKEELTFLLTYQKEDSNLVYQWSTDTLKMKYFEQKFKKKKDEIVDTSLKYNLNVKNRATVDLNSKINFLFDTPLLSFDTTKIDLFAVIDSIEIPIRCNFLKDSVKHRKYYMTVDWSEDSIYRLEIYPNAFTDIYETVNDTNIIELVTQKRDYYGRILVDITGIDSSFQVVCQLVQPGKDIEILYREKTIQSDQIIEYDFLPPKEFIFKLILDRNFNGKWDTGEYLKNIQPEEVLYHEDKIKVRSNWDNEINFNVKK